MILTDGWPDREVALYFGRSIETVNRLVALIQLTQYVPRRAAVEVDLGRFFETNRC